MPRPASAIQLLPNAQVPYQRKPMTSAAIVATMIATQFTYPSSVEGLHPPTRASVVGLPPNPAEARAGAQAPAGIPTLGWLHRSGCRQALHRRVGVRRRGGRQTGSA